MKIIASADHHFDQHSRWAECLRVHSWIAELVESERPDVFLSGGDLYERASTPVERAAVADWLVRIAAVCPVVIARGNHDKPRDCEILGRLASAHPIVVEEGADIHVVGGIAVAAVAWPHRAELLALAGDDGSAGADELASEALRNVLRGLGHELAKFQGPRVLLGHFMIDGSVTSSGQPLIGHTMNVALSDLGLARADITIGGHVHAPQDWTFDGRPIVYAGSPCRTNFGELEEKSVVLAEFNSDGLTSWRRVPTPATPMVHVDAEVSLEGDVLELRVDPEMEAVVGAEVRLRYVVDADQREGGKSLAARTRADLLAAGAVDVKVEEVVRPTTRARAPEVAKASTLEEKLRAFWDVKGTTPDESRATELIRKLNHLDEVCDAA